MFALSALTESCADNVGSVAIAQGTDRDEQDHPQIVSIKTLLSMTLSAIATSKQKICKDAHACDDCKQE